MPFLACGDLSGWDDPDANYPLSYTHATPAHGAASEPLAGAAARHPDTPPAVTPQPEPQPAAHPTPPSRGEQAPEAARNAPGSGTSSAPPLSGYRSLDPLAPPTAPAYRTALAMKRSQLAPDR